jgi:Domain of unknown function (DUF4350)
MRRASMVRSVFLTPLCIGLLLLLASTVPAHAKPKVLFDQGHGQRFVIKRGNDLDLSRLAGLFQEAGFEVTSSTAQLTANTLAGIDALVLSGTFQPYTPKEIAAITAFIDHGGALCIMLHIAPPLAPLMFRLGIEHSNGVIHEQSDIIDGNPLDFRVTRLEKHPLFQGLRQFSLYGVWALHAIGPGVRTIAQSSPASWVDLNGNGRLDPKDARQSFAVAVAGQSGRGRFVVFGDDAIFQNKFLVGNNLTLGRNLASWLMSGTVQPRRYIRAPAGKGRTLLTVGGAEVSPGSP